MRLAILFCAFVIPAFLFGQKSLVFQPEKPQPGQRLTIVYHASATPLSGENVIEATAYILPKYNMVVAEEIVLKKTNDYYTGTIQTNDSTKVVFVSFKTDAKTDNNSGKGYYCFMYDKKGKPVTGARLASSYVFNGTGSIWGLDRNADLAYQMMKDEFQEHPEAALKYKGDYLAALSRSDEEGDRKLLREKLYQMTNQPHPSEEDLSLAKQYYERTFKDSAAANRIKNLLEKEYPHGDWIKEEAINSFYRAAGASKKEVIYNQLVTDYPATKPNEQDTYDYLVLNLATEYAQAGNVQKSEAYVQRIQSKYVKALALNNIAWTLCGGGIDKKPIDPVKGKELSAQSIDLVRDEMNTLKGRPTYFTPRQWKHYLEGSYGTFQDTYAAFLYQAKDYEGAYQHEKEAVTFSPSVYAYAIFTDLTEKTKGKEAAQKELENYIRLGKSNTQMKDQLKTIYLSNHSTSEWEAYINSLEKVANEEARKEIVAKMIQMPAPGFKLKDVNGNVVDLASLKGRTVVVDFWATWCGPCKASFPGMQKAVNKYKDDSTVVFLFIDTWETAKNAEQLVQDFIKKNQYSFTVLYDEPIKNGNDYGVVGAYKVDGIPTKFVIDANNNIRFKVVGFNGDDDALVEELSAMIDLARK